MKYYTTLYAIGETENITDIQRQRALDLGAELCLGLFPEYTITYPSVLIVSGYCKTIIVADDQGQATVDQVQAAQAQVPQENN